MSLLRVSYAATMVACWTVPTLAQTDQIAMAHAAAANELGVLEYCQGQGAVGLDAVAAQRSSIGRLPASPVNTDAAEALGRQGTISANGSSLALSGIASSRNTTVAVVCKQMGDAAIQAAAAFASNGASMAMPAMPANMGATPAMPSMPPGMGAMPPMPPGMGAMPPMPGTPPSR